MLIPHPLLGPRDASEFVCLGDASLIDRPDPAAPDAEALFHDYVYLRDNPAGETRDVWYHEAGCGAWLVVTRDTVTHEVLATALAAEASSGGASSAPS